MPELAKIAPRLPQAGRGARPQPRKQDGVTGFVSLEHSRIRCLEANAAAPGRRPPGPKRPRATSVAVVNHRRRWCVVAGRRCVIAAARCDRSTQAEADKASYDRRACGVATAMVVVMPAAMPV